MKIEPKFTKGPWHRNIPPATKYPTIYAGHNTHVASVVQTRLPPDEVDANASLIAAAPEMLEMLQKWAILNEEHYKDLSGLIRKTREIIEKATTI